MSGMLWPCTTTQTSSLHDKVVQLQSWRWSNNFLSRWNCISDHVQSLVLNSPNPVTQVMTWKAIHGKEAAIVF